MKHIFFSSFLIAMMLLGACSRESQYPGGSGFIEATEVVVSSEVSGQIKAIYFDEGLTVSTGDTLAFIDTVTAALRVHETQEAVHVAEKKINIASLNVQQASHNLDLAKREYERFSTLIRSGSVNQQMFDRTENEYKQAVLAKKQADAAYESARAELAKVRSQLSLLNKKLEDCFPTSPLSGVVTDKYVEAGEWTSTGKPLVKVARLDTVWVKVYLPPEDLTQIVLGGRAEIDPEDGRNRILEGRVSWIASEAEFTPKNIQTEEARAGLVYAVKVNVPNPGGVLKVGMPVSVRIK